MPIIWTASFITDLQLRNGSSYTTTTITFMCWRVWPVSLSLRTVSWQQKTNSWFSVAVETTTDLGCTFCLTGCDRCDKGYDERRQHRCQYRCPACLRHDCPRQEDDKIPCPDYNLEFNGVDCFNYHKLSADWWNSSSRPVLILIPVSGLLPDHQYPDSKPWQWSSL